MHLSDALFADSYAIEADVAAHKASAILRKLGSP